jgi:hypothetical protein
LWLQEKTLYLQQIQLAEEKLKGQASKNQDDSIGWLLNTKQQSKMETDSRIRQELIFT